MMKTYIAIILTLFITLSGHNSYGNSNTPEKFVKDFYTWYIKELTSTGTQNPLLDDAIYKYIDKCIVRKLRINLERNSVDIDYFTFSQDYFDTWIKTFKTYGTMKINESTFVVPVSLYGDIENSPVLLVFLKEENRTLHIIKVRKIN